MKTLITFILVCLFASPLVAQQIQPIKWAFYTKKNSDLSYTIYAKATMEKGWHVFALDPGGDGLLIPTRFTLAESKGITRQGDVEVEGELVKASMEAVGEVNYYEKEVIFKQRITVKGQTKASGTVSFQMCNEQMCLPPEDLNFTVEL